MKRTRVGLLAGLWLLALGAAAHGSTIACWVNGGQPGSQAFTPGTGSAHVTAANMVRGSGLGAPAASGSLSSNGWNGEDPDDYISLGISVDPGYKVVLADLWIGTRSSATGPGLMGVYTSTDSFSAPVFTINQAPGGNRVNSVINLSGLGAVSGSFFIRLMQVGDAAANGGATASTGSFRVADYTADGGATFVDTRITGETRPLPLPGAAGLLGSGLIGVAAFRGKRRE